MDYCSHLLSYLKEMLSLKLLQVPLGSHILKHHCISPPNIKLRKLPLDQMSELCDDLAPHTQNPAIRMLKARVLQPLFLPRLTRGLLPQLCRTR